MLSVVLAAQPSRKESRKTLVNTACPSTFGLSRIFCKSRILEAILELYPVDLCSFQNILEVLSANLWYHNALHVCSRTTALDRADPLHRRIGWERAVGGFLSVLRILEY